MSATYWDPELGRGGGNGEPQQLELNGFTLSLVPDGGSVQLPVGYVSSVGSVLVVSSVQARDKIIVGPNSNVIITSTGQIQASTIASQLINSFTVNATNNSLTNLSTVNGQITNFFTPNGNATQLNALAISSGMETVSSIKAGGITISKDTGIGYSKVTGDQITFYQNIYQDSPGQNINGKFFNGENYNATSSIQASNFIRVSNPASNGIINLNEHILSNTSLNLTYDSNPIYTGQRGDASAWAQFPATTYVNANGQDVRNVNGLYANGIQAGGATIDNTANIVTNTQTGTVNVLTKDGTNVTFAPGNFNVGFSGGNPASTQPNINLKGNAVNIAAGDQFSPTYAAGRTINIDAYAGASAQLLPPFANANSYINITSHGNSVGVIPVFGKGTGNITLTAYNAYNGGVPDPFSPGVITLNASLVNIGNPTYTGLGTSAVVNVQGAIVQTIAGLQLAGDPAIPSYQIRSAGGVTIYNDPTGYSNRDSRLYVRDIFGHSNFVSDFGPPALTLDGLQGGLTLNNFSYLSGQDGAAMDNIASLTGPYATNVQNQINALQGSISLISTTGGTSNLALWFQYPAQSTVVFNKGLNLVDGSISSVNGLIVNDTVGNLANTYQRRVYIDGKTPTTGSTMMYYDTSAVSFINPGNLAYNNIRANGVYFGPSNFLNVSSGYLQFNGSNLISTSSSGGGGGGGSNFGPNPIVSTIQITASGIFQEGEYGTTEFAATNGLRIQAVSGTGLLLQGNQLLSQQEATGTSVPFIQLNCLASQSATFPNVALLNISTINNIPISSLINGNSGPSSIQNWSYFPVLSNAIQFGNQSAWIKGEANALFTTSDGTNTIPVLAQSFSVYDPNTSNIIRNIGLDSNSILTARRTNDHPSDFRVSSLILGVSPLTTDGTDLYLNGSNIGSASIATWANYPATSTIRGSNIVLSNVGANLSIFDTQENPADPRSTSLFLSPFQLQLADRVGIGANTIGMTNQSNSLQIFNRSYDGATIQTGGNIQNLRIVGDVQLGFGFGLTAPSTFTEGLAVSSICLNGSNNLNASNGFLYFNGTAVNTGTSVANWASFPASQNVSMGNYQINNVTAVSGGSIPGGGFNITTNFVQFSGPQGVQAILPSYNYQSNAIKAIAGNIAIDGSASNYMVSPYGYAHQQPTGLGWFNTSVNGTGQYQIRQFLGSNIISTGTIYDTTYYPLPTFPIVYCGPQDTQITFNYSGGSPSSWTTITPLGNIVPTTNQGIVSFSVIPPSSYSSSNCYIGIGLVGTTNYSNMYVTRVEQYDPNLNTFNRKTLLIDFTGYVGSNFTFRLAGVPSGIFTFADCYFKPLPN